uniref:Uncharacterized protein n=1 Tax=Rhipicephalus pulchellus TaxID=72859 RepID=L7MBH5_RHIPC
MGTQGGYPYGNSQYGGYGGANSLMPPPPGPQYPKAAGAASTMGAVPPQAPGVPPRPMYLRQHLQQKMYGYNSPMTPPGGDGASPSPSEGGPPPPGGGPMPPGACYSQCPPAPMSGPSSLLSQQGGVGGSPPVTGPGQDGGGGGRSQLAPPPTVLDEGSQASNASASSSLPEEHLGPGDKGGSSKQPPMSHPPTPNTLPSPGGASMSSFHDEFESVSSPSWPRTPASPVSGRPRSQVPSTTMFSVRGWPLLRLWWPPLLSFNMSGEAFNFARTYVQLGSFLMGTRRQLASLACDSCLQGCSSYAMQLCLEK